MLKRVIVIDEQPIARAGITTVLARRSDLMVIGEAGDGDAAVRLVERERPDLTLMELSFRSGLKSLELIARMRELHPAMRVLVVSAHDEELYGERVFRAGAHGYVMKRAPLPRMLEAIDRVLAGGVYASSELLERVAEATVAPPSRANRPPPPLSPRERAVLVLIGDGVGTRDIAQRLQLSVKTVETHRAHLKLKLGLETAPQLVRYAVQWRADNPQSATAASDGSDATGDGATTRGPADSE